MSGVDTAKEVVRIASTAGLAKDVIDLMEKKLVLLTDELGLSHQKTVNLEMKVSKLEIENGQLRAQLVKPQTTLDEIAANILVSIANAPDGAWKQDLFEQFRVSPAKGEHLFDQLIEHKFIEAIPRITPDGTPFRATQKGREYLNKKGLL